MATDVILDWFDDALNDPAATPGQVRDETMVLSRASELVASNETNIDTRFTSLDEAGFFENMWNGGRTWSAPLALADGTIDYAINGVANNEVDDTWGGMASLDDPTKAKINEIIQLSQNGSRGANAIMRKLELARNEGYTRYWLDRATEVLELERKIQEANVLGGYGIGAAGGVALDIGLMILAGGGVTAPNAFGRLILQGGNALARNTQAGARLVAGARIAAIGAAESGLQETAQSLRDITVDEQDIWTAMGFGAVAGFGLGAAFPKAVGGVVTKEHLEAVERQMAEEFAERATLQSGGKPVDLSAAAPRANTAFEMADEIAQASPGKGAGGLGVARGTLGKTKAGRALQSPKNQIRDMGITGKKLEETEGLVGKITTWRFFQELYKSAAATEGELAGTEVRHLAYSEMLREMDDELGVHEVTVVKDIYDSMMDEVFGVGKLKSAMVNDELAGTATNFAREKAGKDRLITQQQFNDEASTYAKIRQADLDEPDAPRAPDYLDSLVNKYNVDPNNAEAFKAKVKALADADDEYYMQWAQRGVRVGVLNADDIKPGYRPQNWLADEVKSNEQEFKAALRGVFGRQATEEFANEFWADLAEQEAKEGAAGVLKPLIDIEAGETMRDLARKNPALHNEINRAWDEHTKDALQAQLDDKAWTAGYEDEIAVEESRLALIARNDANSEKALKRLGKLADELEKMPARWTRKRAALAERITDLEHELGKYRDRANRARELQGRTDAIRALIKKEGANAEKRAIKKTLKAHSRAEKKAMKAFVAKTLQEKVDEAYKLISREESAFGMIPDELIAESKHFKHRGIDLRGFEADPLIKRFLNNEDQFTRTQYVLGYGRQVALREKFLPILNKQGRGNIELDHKEFIETLKSEALKGFEADRAALEARRAKGEDVGKLLTALNKDHTQAKNLVDKAFAEILRTDQLNMSPLAHGVTNTLMAGASASLLGQVLAAMFGDSAMMALAGGQFGTGWKSFFRVLRKKRILQEIAEDDAAMAHMLRAPHVMDQGFQMARFGMDQADFEVPGGVAQSIARKVSDVAKKEGWLSGMHAWNRHLRSSFNLDFAEQIVKHSAGGWDSLDESLQKFYRRQGFGPKQMEAFNEAMKRGGRSVYGGQFRIPDSSKFAANGDSESLKGFLRVLRAAGDEALLDPQIGDRPFLKSHPMGKLLLQFSSFMYTASERYWIPMVQGALSGDPKTMGTVFASFTWAILMAGVGNSLRAYNRGEGEEYINEITGSPQGVYNGLKEAFLRSPFVFGLSGSMIDIAGVHFGKPVNSAFQAATGSNFQPVDTKYTKLRQDQGVAGLVPVLGLANTALETSRKATEGNWDKVANRAAYRVPLYNTLPAQLMARVSNQITGTPLLPGQRE